MCETLIITLILTIIGWLITIALTCYNVKSSAKDTDRKIAAIQESTAKQIESVKILTKTLIEVNRLLIGNELSKERNYHLQSIQKKGDLYEQDNIASQLGISATKIQNSSDKHRDLSYEEEFHFRRKRELEDCMEKLSTIAKVIEGD